MHKAHRHKRKAPVTVPTAAASESAAQQPSGSSSRPQATRTTIRRFHTLIKRQAQLQQIIRGGQKNSDSQSAQAELARVEKEIEDLGGLAAYQRMSTIGQGKDRGGGSEKVLISWMRDLGLHNAATRSGAGESGRLRLVPVVPATLSLPCNPGHSGTCDLLTMDFPLAPSSLLEVGALKPDNYASCQTWIDVTPIDLHAQHPDIREQDFLLMHPEEHRERWDVISLSLVLNFPPDPKDRGKCTVG